MTTVIVHAPVEVNRRIAGVTFTEGRAEVVVGSAAHQFFKRRGSAYRIDDDEAPVSEPPASDPPATDPPASDPPASDPPASDPPASDPPATDPPASDPADGKPERPHPVQNSAADWFNYLTAIKPDHGLEVGTKRADLITAANAVDGTA